MREVKRYEDWNGDLKDFLEVGDLVDEEIQDHFINVMPPACWTSYIIQMGEPYSHDDEGRATYPTLKKIPEGWIYAGNCKRGQTIPV